MTANPLRRYFPGGFRAILRDRAGSTLPLFAASIIPVMGAIGLSVDAGRAYMVQQRVKSALDLALLASATSAATQSERDATLERYFEANFPENYLGAKIDGFTTVDQRQADAQGTTVDVTATVNITIPTTFMSIFGESYKQLTLNAESRVATAERGDKQALEIMMAIDNTGSMATADVGGD
nr:pilus assembly protein TadG-related protein [Hankyongella ginsenosidimutans]